MECVEKYHCAIIGVFVHHNETMNCAEVFLQQSKIIDYNWPRDKVTKSYKLSSICSISPSWEVSNDVDDRPKKY